jgi:O-methyltransferase
MTTDYREKYLELLLKTLTFSFWRERLINEQGGIRMDKVNPTLPEMNDEEERETGRVAWPEYALTMVGRKRLRNIKDLSMTVVNNGTPGSFVECGVWRGGACIYARHCLPLDRAVYVCDSFTGIPYDPKEAYWSTFSCLAVTQEQVRKNFEMFGVTENVHYVPGLFKDSLHAVPGPIAILRVDGDMYSSTMEILQALYPKVSSGGFVVFDDFNPMPLSKKAVEDYFAPNAIPALTQIDGSATYIQKP